MARIVGYARLQALYKRFLGLELDKGRSEQVIEITSKKLRDLLLAGQKRAYARGDTIVEWIDLPITIALERTIEEYRQEREKLGDPRLDLGPIIEYLEENISGLSIGDTVKDGLQDLTATLLLLAGRIIKIVDPKARKPSKDDIEKARKILDLTI